MAKKTNLRKVVYLYNKKGKVILSYYTPKNIETIYRKTCDTLDRFERGYTLFRANSDEFRRNLKGLKHDMEIKILEDSFGLID